jgi:hypothetical protein
MPFLVAFLGTANLALILSRAIIVVNLYVDLIFLLMRIVVDWFHFHWKFLQ